MNTGIYIIEHNTSGRVYVGSAVNFTKRRATHFSLLRKNKHHSPYLQRAWNKYGGKAFNFRRLLVCSKEDLIVYEQRAIDIYQAANGKHGFNARPTAESMLGFRHSPDSIARNRASKIGVPRKAETIAKLTGRKLPPEVCQKMSLSRTGTKKSPECVAKIVAANTGRRMSIETKEKLRISNLGKTHTTEIRGKMQLTHKNRLLLLRPKEYIMADNIREMFSTGKYKQSNLARQFGVSMNKVNRIILGKIWVRP